MFYCDSCARERDWFIMVGSRSHGTCEICGKSRDCNDCPSYLLPIPRNTDEHHPQTEVEV